MIGTHNFAVSLISNQTRLPWMTEVEEIKLHIQEDQELIYQNAQLCLPLVAGTRIRHK